MTGGFEADAARLTACVKEFDDLANRAAKIAAELEGALKGAETAWGDDEAGQSFADAHAGPAAQSTEQVRGLSAALSQLGGAFGEAARRNLVVDAGKSIGENAGG